jgi:hypothetical protein
MQFYLLRVFCCGRIYGNVFHYYHIAITTYISTEDRWIFIRLPCTVSLIHKRSQAPIMADITLRHNSSILHIRHQLLLWLSNFNLSCQLMIHIVLLVHSVSCLFQFKFVFRDLLLQPFNNAVAHCINLIKRTYLVFALVDYFLHFLYF